jgi:hypothetical protein
MPAPSRHGGGGVPPTRGRRDESPLRRCNLEDSPPLKRGRGRLQVSLPKDGERRMPSMPSYGDGSRRESRPAPPAPGLGADVAQRLTNAINAMVNRVVTFCEDIWKVYAEQWLAILRWDLQRVHGIQEEVLVIK